jgi:hypothetical protein
LIAAVVGGCILISLQMSSSEVNWFTYFKGAVAGLFLSGVILEVLNVRRRKKEEEEEKKPKRVEL